MPVNERHLWHALNNIMREIDTGVLIDAYSLRASGQRCDGYRVATGGSAAQNAKGRVVVIDDVKMVVGNALQLGARMHAMGAATPLLGAIPELDSMAVVNVITALEEHFGINVADDEIGAATFATLGSLSAFVEQKLEA